MAVKLTDEQITTLRQKMSPGRADIAMLSHRELADLLDQTRMSQATRAVWARDEAAKRLRSLAEVSEMLAEIGPT